MSACKNRWKQGAQSSSRFRTIPRTNLSSASPRVRRLLVIYLIALHAAVALLIWRTDFTARVHNFTVRHGLVMPRGTAYVGDSITAKMPWPNYGLAGLTTRELLPMLANYRNADRIVLTIGLTDLVRGETPAFAEIVNFEKPIVWLALHPNRRVDVTAANDAIRAICKAPRCTFIDAGPLPLAIDGLHVADYRPIARALAAQVRTVPGSTSSCKFTSIQPLLPVN